MNGCFVLLLLVAGGIFVMVSIIRWFEQVTEAVDLGWWNKVALLVAMPFAVWLYPSKVAAGRPSAVPHHEPVRGFGEPTKPAIPKPPLKKKGRPPIDPEMVAKLKQKMRDQGMLKDEDKPDS